MVQSLTLDRQDMLSLVQAFTLDRQDKLFVVQALTLDRQDKLPVFQDKPDKLTGGEGMKMKQEV